MDIYMDKDNVAMLMELLMEHHMKGLERVCESVGDVVDIIRFGDDLGMDSGPFMSIDIYRGLFHDHRKRMSDYVHNNSSMHTFIHSCGSGLFSTYPNSFEEGD